MSLCLVDISLLLQHPRLHCFPPVSPLDAKPPTSPLKTAVAKREPSLVFFCGPDQVLRSEKVLDEQWRDAWQAKVVKSQTPLKRARGKRAPERVDRLASQHFLEDINHSLLTAGKRLRDFAQPDEAFESPLKRPRTLVLCSDQESLQVSAMNYLCHFRKLFTLHVKDPGHRNWNDVWAALGDAQLSKTAMLMLNLYNSKWGPWNRSGWFAKLQEAAKTLSENLGPNDPLLQVFMPGILADARRHESENTEQERAAFLKSLPELVSSKGPKASESRFFSIVHAHQHLDGMWSAQSFLYCACCLLQGWASHADDLWSPTGCAQDLAVQKKVQAESSEGHMSKKTAKSLAKDEMDELRKKSKNSLHMLTKMMVDPDMKSVARIIAYVCEAETFAAGNMFRDLRSAQLTREIYSGWSHWAWIHTAKQTISVLHDLEQLSRIGFNLSCSGDVSPDSVVSEDSLASTMWRFLAALLRRRAGSNLWYTSGGGSSAGLIHKDSEKVQASLVFFKAAADTISAVQSSGSLQAKKALVGHDFTTAFSQWVFKALATTDYKSVPPVLHDHLHDVWGCILNSKIVEDGNKLQREEETRSSNSRFVSAEQGWYLLTQHSLLQKYGRKEVSNKRLKHVPAGFSLSDAFQTKRPREMSEEQKADWDLIKDITGKLQWATHNPETEQERWADFAVLQKLSASGKWGDFESAWHAGLLPEYAIVIIEEHPLYVVHTYKHAALIWPMVWGPEQSVFFDLEVGNLSWIYLFNTEDVQVCSILPRCPQAMSQTALANKGIVLQVGPAKSLVDWHAEHGFNGVKEACLRKLCSSLGFDDVKWEPDNCNAELSWSVHLMLNLDPSLSEAEVNSRVWHRYHGYREVANVQEDELLESIVDCLLPSEQHKALSSVAEESRKGKRMLSLSKDISKTYKSAWAALPAEKRKSGNERRKAKEKERQQKLKKEGEAQSNLRAYAARSLNADEALKACLPRGARAYADDYNGRWRLTWIATGQQKSISWTSCGARMAAAACIRQVWTWSEMLCQGGMPADVGNIVKKLEK